MDMSEYSWILIWAEGVINEGLFVQAVNLMDDELREELHRDLAPTTPLVFLASYAVKHYEKYGEYFTVL